MPLVNVPIIHKFGIISHSRRLELQERLLQAALQDAQQSNKGKSEPQKNPFEVSEEFIKTYNTANTPLDKEKCEKEAQKLLTRVKRRVGIKDGGLGSHVNIPFAWTELIFLAHCKGKVHQDSLDVLLISLEQAPVGFYLIPALFYIAETVLYWLQTETVQQDVLKSAEIKTLKIGQITFFRLFYHFMTGHLSNVDDSLARLDMYLLEFDKLQHLYESYPEINFAHKFISHIGKLIVSGCIKKNQSNTDYNQVQSDKINDGELQSPEPHGDNSSKSVISTEVHHLSPCLWHALDVWRCARHLGGELKDALDSFLLCSYDIQSCNWIDAYLALNIVANAACEDSTVLRYYQLMSIDRQIRIRKQSSHNMSNEEGVGSVTNRQYTGTKTTTTFPVLDSAMDDHNSTSVSSTTNDEPNIKTQLVKSQFDTDFESNSETEDVQVGLSSWPIELVVPYIQSLSRICLNGSTSSIRQAALMDRNSSLTTLSTYGVPSNESDDFKWKVRYLALQGLTVVTKAALVDPMKQCLKDAAWPAINDMQNYEQNSNVLDGKRLGDFWGEIEKLSNEYHPASLSGLMSHMSYALTMLYLPALPPPVKLKPAANQKQGQSTNRPKLATKTSVNKSVKLPTRTSLKQEISLATALQNPIPDFLSRKNFDLRRVVEDQWRKENRAVLEDENKTRKDDILKKFNQKV